MIQKITDCIHKINIDSNSYFLDFDKKIIIDTCSRSDRTQYLEELKQLVDLNDVEIVILTHMHYDHCGNTDVFPNAKVYASKEEIESFEQDDFGTVLNSAGVVTMNLIDLNAIPNEIEGLKVTLTPGHTKGCICLFYEKEKIIFTGDHWFGKELFGRVDLPTSVSEELENSKKKLFKIKFKTLCPGHDYIDD